MKTPYTSEFDTMRGRHHFGTLKKSHSSSHQSCLCRLKRSVRHALVPSVMCLPPSLPPVYCCAGGHDQSVHAQSEKERDERPT